MQPFFSVKKTLNFPKHNFSSHIQAQTGTTQTLGLCIRSLCSTKALVRALI